MTIEVPKEWRQIGFSGLFHLESMLVHEDGRPFTVDEAYEFDQKLPSMLPFGTNSGWLGLEVEQDEDGAWFVHLVRKDAAALTDFMFRPRRRPVENVTPKEGVL